MEIFIFFFLILSKMLKIDKVYKILIKGLKVKFIYKSEKIFIFSLIVD